MGEIVFLLGAGASKDAGLPLMEELTSGFPTWLDGRKEWKDHTAKLKAVFESAVTVASHDTASPNIELVLSFLHSAAQFKNDNYASAITGWRAPFDVPADILKMLIAGLQAYIHDRLRVFNPAAGDYLSGLLDFHDAEEPLDVFTLNYDRLTEAMAARYSVRYTTGFGDVWDPGLFEDKRWGLRIFKLHGSIDWYRVSSRSIVYQGSREHFAFPGEVPAELLLYPAEAKVSHAEPYATLMSHFTRALAAAKMCIAVGYSFRDRDIRRIVLDSMATNRQLQLLIVKPRAEEVINLKADDGDEPTFRQFGDRVVGLWTAAKNAFDNRMIRHRLTEIGMADERIERIRNDRNIRDFSNASASLMSLLELCRNKHMPLKPLRSLSFTGAPEFRETFERELRRVMKGYCNGLDIRPEAFVGAEASGLGGYRGSMAEKFGALTSFWLLCEGLGLAASAAEAREAIRRHLLSSLEGMMFTSNGHFEGWPVPLRPSRGDGDTDQRRVRERLERVKPLCDEFRDWPPATALNVTIPDAARESYNALVSGLAVVSDFFTALIETGIQRFQSHSVGHYYAPKVADADARLAGLKTRFMPTATAWNLTPTEQATTRKLTRVVAT